MILILLLLSTFASAQTTNLNVPNATSLARDTAPEYDMCFEDSEYNQYGECSEDYQIPPTPTPTPKPRDPKCDQRYQRLFQDGTVNITMAWGYGDAGGSIEDEVWSEYWSNLAIEKLTSACPSSYEQGPSSDPVVLEEREHCGGLHSYNKSCGFRRTDDQEIFEKSIIDINGKQTTVKLRLLRSPLSSSDKTNRASVDQFIQDRVCNTSTNKPQCTTQNKASLTENTIKTKCQAQDHLVYQPCRSLYVRNAWESSIKQGDEIVIYNGHARDGGGPSFEIPRTLADGHVDYGWYRANRPGHNREISAFRYANTTTKKAPVFYFSHSCSGKKHFYDNGSFPEVSKSTAFILANRLAYTDEMVASTLSSFENIFNFQCQPEFSTKLQEASCSYNINNF